MISIDDRIKAIDASIETGEKKVINYQHDLDPRPVKRIPLKYLLYNPHNGRIRSHTKSYESTFHILNPEDPGDILIIEQYLYDSATGKNEKTLESLEENGQQEVGIVTKDGIIIDGNRRAMLLNILSRKNNEEGFFNAVVLPDTLLANKKEIITLETSYQMGVDSKVDYNPIEKYIRCKDLQSLHGYSIEQIAKIMAEAEKRIIEWLGILSLMDEYLAFLGSPEVYTRLEKREGHFVDLHTYLKTYRTGRRSTAKWDFGESDLEDLTKAYFIYIRLGVPVLRARVIAKPTNSNSFFCHKNIWDDFLTDHTEIIESYKEQEFLPLTKAIPKISNEDIVRELDNTWREKIGDRLVENMSYSEGILKDTLELYAPLKILKRIINSLGQIDERSFGETNKEELISCLAQISKKVETLNTAVLSK